MNLAKRYGRHLPLGLLVVFLPFVLLVLAGIINYIYNFGSLSALLVRFLPIHVGLAALAFQTIRATRQETFQFREFSSDGSSKWFVISCAICLLLILLMFWPVSNWSSQLFGGNGDGYNWRWQIWRMSQEFREWHLFPTRFDDVIAPYGVDLRLNDGYLSMYVGGLWNLITGPTLAYNLTLATSVVLNFFAARKLSLTVSNSQVTGIFAGIIMATAPSITLRQMGHLNLCFSFVVCLAAIEGIKLIEVKKVRIWKPVLVLTLAFFSSFYFFVLSGCLYAACVLICLAKNFLDFKPLFKSNFMRLTSVALITGIIISPFIFTRLHHDKVERTAGAPAATARTDEYIYYSADPRTFFIPASDARFQLPQLTEFREDTSPNSVENTPFPGYLAILSVAIAVLLVKKWRWLIASLWSVFTILALGPSLIWGSESQFSNFFPRALVKSVSSEPVTWLPYGNLTSIPGLSALRTPNRFAMALPVIGIIALAAIANELAKHDRSGRFRAVAFSSAVLLVLPNLRSSDYWYNTSFTNSVEQALNVIRQDPSDARVLVAGQNCLQTISFVNLQIEHHHPMVGCQTFSAAVPWYSSLKKYRNSSALAALQCDPTTFGLAPMNTNNEAISPDEVLKKLKEDLLIGYVVFPKKFVCQDSIRTQELENILRSSPEVLADTSDFLIVRS